MADYKPLNPNSKVKDGRLGGVNFFISKVYSEAVPNFNEFIEVEDRQNAALKCIFKDDFRVTCLSTNMYKNSWSLMRPVGLFASDEIIMMTGMSTRDERDPIPRRLFVFRISDVETKVISTSVGEREATFFSLDQKDNWDQFSCDARDVGKVIRSVAEKSVDPDITNGPFKSYLTSLISGTRMPDETGPSNGAPADDDWDSDIPF